jgi:hypothetical protein
LGIGVEGAGKEVSGWGFGVVRDGEERRARVGGFYVRVTVRLEIKCHVLRVDKQVQPCGCGKGERVKLVLTTLRTVHQGGRAAGE